MLPYCMRLSSYEDAFTLRILILCSAFCNITFFTERNFVVSTDRIMPMLFTVAVLSVVLARALPTLQ
jgi:hypothetical protein